MSHLQEKEQKILMTSHVLVMAAWEFVPPNNSRSTYDNEDRGRRIPALICTAPLSRALVANVFVQTREHLWHNVVDFFLHDKVIRAFRIPILFVYCVLIRRGYESPWNPISTVQRISETMPHIQTLDVQELPKINEEAFAAALPKTLWSLCLVRSIEGFCFDVGFINQLADGCPFLQRLELKELDPDACKVMFSPDKNLFPNLRALSVSTRTQSSAELYDRAFTSQVVSSPRLESLEFCAARSQQPIPAPSLKPLEQLRSISSLFKWSTLSTVPDFSVLNCCSELTGLLFVAKFTVNQQQQQQAVIDLSIMPCLTSLGPSTLDRCKGVHTLVLPPTLRTVGPYFCFGSSVQHINFSVCAESLCFVDTEQFLSWAQQIETFSTLPLLGKIGTVVEDFFLSSCHKLRHIDLRGLQGIVEIKDRFLAGTGVEELDLSALAPTCTKIGKDFLSDCYSLKKVTGSLSSVTSVGTHFLHSTGKLLEFDFAAMKALASLDLEGLIENSALEERGTKILNGIIEENGGTLLRRRSRDDGEQVEVEDEADEECADDFDEEAEEEVEDDEEDDDFEYEEGGRMKTISEPGSFGNLTFLQWRR